MPVDLARLEAIATFTDPVTGVSERFVDVPLRSGSTVGVLSLPVGAHATTGMDELQGSSNGNRVEFRRFESTSLQAFQSVSEQEITVSSVLEWVDASFPKSSSTAAPGMEPSRSAARGSR